MLFNDRRKLRKQSAAERAQVHAAAAQDVNPFVSRKEKYASAAKLVSPETRVAETMKQYNERKGKKLIKEAIAQKDWDALIRGGAKVATPKKKSN